MVEIEGGTAVLSDAEFFSATAQDLKTPVKACAGSTEDLTIIPAEIIESDYTEYVLLIYIV